MRRELATYDGPFDGLIAARPASAETEHATPRLEPLSGAAGQPAHSCFFCPGCRISSGWNFPAPGTPVAVTAENLDVPHSALTWTGIEVQQQSESGWVVAWPDQSASLMHEQSTLLELPTRVPASIVHKHQPIFNRLIGNPAGYLPDGAPMAAIRIDMPRQELHPLGPGWFAQLA